MLKADQLIEKIDRKKIIEALADICERDGITAEAIAGAQIKGITVSAKDWQAMHKDNDGNAVVTSLSGGGSKITLSPSWETGPKWPIVTPAVLPKIVPTKRVKKPKTTSKTILLIPDVHIAHIRPDDSEAVVPAWDLAADSALRQVAAELQPDEIIQLGDLLDLSEHGRWDKWPAWARTTNPDFQAACEWWCKWRADHPEAKLTYLQGNHEQRLEKSLIVNNTAAFGLTPAKLPGEVRGWPAHSIPVFLRLDEIGVEWLPGYPSAEYWIHPEIALIHGRSDPGQKDMGANHTIIMGHFHRIVQKWMTRSDRLGSHEVGQICVGTMSPVDGQTPSGAQGLNAWGSPNARPGVENWQGGAGVVTIHEDGDWLYEQIFIRKGRAQFRGQTYTQF